MAQIVKLRRSSVSGQKPTNDNLQLGELAVNTTDGKVFLAKSGSLGPTIEEIVTTNTIITGSINLIGGITVSGDISGSNIKASSFIKSGGLPTQYLMADGSVSTLTNPVTGTGTTNYLSKFTASGSLSNSIIYDNGTNVGIGTTTPVAKLDVNGNVNAYSYKFNLPSSITPTPNTLIPKTDGTRPIWYDNSSVGNDLAFKSDVDNIQIGGRNLFKKTTNVTSVGDISSIIKNELNGFTVTTSTNNSGIRINKVLTENGQYTFSGYVTCTVSGTVGVDFNDVAFDSISVSPTRTKFTITKTISNYTEQVYNFIDLNNLPAGTYIFENIKIEKGNKSTDWTPAPEDKQDRLQDISGNIGVGKPDASATEKLDVNGNIKATSFIKSGGTSTQFLMADGSVSTLTNPITGTGTTNYLSKFTASGTIGNSLIYDDGDKVGIGINSGLVGKFEVVGTSVSGSFIAARFHNNTTNAAGVKTKIELPIFNGSSGGTIEEIGNSIDGYRLNMYQSQTSGVITFGTAGNNERMRITSTGDIGIGTTSPSSKLNVVGDQLIVASSSGTTTLGIQIKPTISVIPTGQVHAYIGVGDTNIGTNGDLIIAPRTNVNASVRIYTGTNPSEKIRIDGATGNLGVGTTTPNNKLDVNGNTTLSGSLMVSQSLIQYSSVASVPSGSVIDVATFNTSSYTATFFDFVITSGSNTRAGTIFTTWNGNNIEYTETSTNDIGDTTSIRLSTSLSVGSVKLQATSIMGSWSVKTLARMI